MAEPIVRCPYCILSDHFRPMLKRLEDWFIYTKCGHTATPGLAYYRCQCKKCQEMNRAA
jgi:hypothetical protein